MSESSDHRRFGRGLITEFQSPWQAPGSMFSSSSSAAETFADRISTAVVAELVL